MTVEEAAGETPLAAATISLTLEHVDLAALAPDAPDPEVRRFMRKYLDKVASHGPTGGPQGELPLSLEPEAAAVAV